MAKAYCIFLRGVNIGTIRIKMLDLRQAFVQMGFLDVQTKLSTGNVIAAEPKETHGREELRELIERGLSERFGYQAYVLLRDLKDLEEICAAAQMMHVPEGCHQYILLCDDKNTIFELTQRFEAVPHIEQEQWMPHSQAAFWIVPKGMTLESEFGSRVLGDQRYKSRLTSRNLLTIEKIRQQMHAM